MTFAGNQFRADEQIEKALSDVGASKFYRDVKSNAEMLLGRAEEMLWPAGGDRRVLWRDVVSRSLTNERWPWLPPKGLEELRKLAEARAAGSTRKRAISRKVPSQSRELAFWQASAITKRKPAPPSWRFWLKMPDLTAVSTIVSNPEFLPPARPFQTRSTQLMPRCSGSSLSIQTELTQPGEPLRWEKNSPLPTSASPSLVASVASNSRSNRVASSAGIPPVPIPRERRRYWVKSTFLATPKPQSTLTPRTRASVLPATSPSLVPIRPALRLTNLVRPTPQETRLPRQY